jgi:hypothetical protein
MFLNFITVLGNYRETNILQPLLRNGFTNKRVSEETRGCDNEGRRFLRSSCREVISRKSYCAESC